MLVTFVMLIVHTPAVYVTGVYLFIALVLCTVDVLQYCSLFISCENETHDVFSFCHNKLISMTEHLRSK